VRYVSRCNTLGISNPYPERGPLPNFDTFGILLACDILIRSLDSGINSTNVQFSTIRKLRSHVSNFVHTTATGVGATFMAEEGKSHTISQSPTNSYWFKRFILGCHKRMGDVLIPDQPITIEELKAVLEMQKELLEPTSWEDKSRLLKIVLTAIIF